MSQPTITNLYPFVGVSRFVNGRIVHALGPWKNSLRATEQILAIAPIRRSIPQLTWMLTDVGQAYSRTLASGVRIEGRDDVVPEAR
jgi:hypothetical protein